MQVLEKHPSSLLVFLKISRDPPMIRSDRQVTVVNLCFSGVGSVPLVFIAAAASAASKRCVNCEPTARALVVSLIVCAVCVYCC